jgi:hypothetical protein
MAMMAITTSSSMSVNARFDSAFILLLLAFNSFLVLPPCLLAHECTRVNTFYVKK